MMPTTGAIIGRGLLYTLIAAVISVPLSIYMGEDWVSHQPDLSFHSGTQWILLGLLVVTPVLNLVGHLLAFVIVPIIVLRRRCKGEPGRWSLFSKLLAAALAVQAILGLLVYGPLPGLLYLGCMLPLMGATAILLVPFASWIEK